ncbi:LysE family translocator [Caballeronia sp. DA-9]|uniref:LysE family translocator n=1 Tax=Caballeronia sp. DA-9 TaxID=3436237 RepID=UPI003F66AD81
MLPSVTFLIAATLLAVIPGPGIAYVVARTVAGGKTEGIASTLGASVGGMFHVFAAALGLSVIVAESALAYGTVKYIGAAYLIYLGIRMLVSDASAPDQIVLSSRGSWKVFRDGIVVEALNVKTAMFFLAFIPHFVSAERALAPQFIVLGATCVLLNSTVDLIAIAIAHRIVGSSAGKATKQRLMGRLSGATMLTLGLLVAITTREG